MWGWGDFSPSLSIRAASPPAQMSAAVTSIDAATGGVKITWSIPANNGNSLTAYKIEILNLAENAWSETTATCNGAQNSVFLARECIVPMSTLIAAPFNLVLDSLVKVRVSAINAAGAGTVSSTNTVGALVRTIPSTMNLPQRGASTSTNRIQVTWNALTAPANGNSAILSYQLVWDAGTGNCNQNLVGHAVDFTGTSYTLTTGVSSGNPYLFKLRARNIYGWSSAYTAEITIIASDVPG